MQLAIELEKDFNLKNHNTFKIASVANAVYFPKNTEEFTTLLKNLENPFILGAGSNILFSSSGVKQPVISTQKLDKLTIEDGIINAQAGVKTGVLSQFALKNSLSGFEFLIPIPATTGGAVFMNASAHNQSISDVFLSARLFDLKTKGIVEFNNTQMQFSYRDSILKSTQWRYIFLEGKFKLSKASEQEIKKKMDENLEFRAKHQPSLKFPNAGSIFKNPENSSAGRLIDECGLRGEKIGGAQIFENHANFIINLGEANSQNVTELMFLAYNKVRDKFGIELEPEILFVGQKSELEEKIWNEMLKK